MPRQTFINLPVKDLARSTAFFTTVGFSFDPQFTDDNATRMIVSDDTSVMLAVERFFKGFITPQDLSSAECRKIRPVAEAFGLVTRLRGCPGARNL